MNKQCAPFLLPWMVLIPSVAVANGGEKIEEKGKKRGILLVAFGSTVERTQGAYDQVNHIRD